MAIAVTNLNRVSSVDPLTYTTTPTVPAGSLLFIAVISSQGGVSAAGGVTDTKSNTYADTVASVKIANASNSRISLVGCYNSNALSASDVITITDGTGTATITAIIGYLTGAIQSSSALDVSSTQSNPGTTATTISLTSSAPGVANEMFLAFVGLSASSGTFTQDITNSWTSTFATASAVIQGGTKLNSGTSAVTYAPSWGSARNNATIIASFKPLVQAPLAVLPRLFSFFDSAQAWIGQLAQVPLTIRLAPLATPVVRSPLYVPSRQSTENWVGKPSTVAAVLLAALSATQVQPQKWRFTVPTETAWQWQAPSRSVLSLATYRVFNPAPWSPSPEPPGWVSGSKSVPLVISAPPPTVLPFATPRRFDTQPEPVKALGSVPVPNVLLQLPAIPPVAARGTRQFNVAYEAPWVRYAPAEPLVFSLQPFVAPLSGPRWNFNIPDVPNWTAKSKASLYLPSVVLAPFVNLAWKFNIPDIGVHWRFSGAAYRFLPVTTVVTTPTQTDRIAFVAFEDRVGFVVSESRSVEIEAEDRIAFVKADSRQRSS